MGRERCGGVSEQKFPDVVDQFADSVLGQNAWRMVTVELVERSAHLFGRGPAPCRGLCVAWLLARWFIIRWCPVSALMPVHMRWGESGILCNISCARLRREFLPLVFTGECR